MGRMGRGALAAMFVFSTLFAGAEHARGALSDFQAGVYVDPQGGTLPYRLFVPLDYDPGRQYPLVLLLHGAGESGTNNTSAASHVSASRIVDHAKTPAYSSFVLVPQTNNGWSTDFGEPPADAMRRTLELIDLLDDSYRIDGRRMYVTGLSMGGYGTWDVLSKRPAMFAAAVPVAGGGDARSAPLFKDVPVWAFHGALDTVVHPNESRRMVNALRAAGGDPLYTEYPDAIHNNVFFGRVYSEPQLYDWMFAQSLVPEPGAAGLAIALGAGLLFRRRRPCPPGSPSPTPTGS